MSSDAEIREAALRLIAGGMDPFRAAVEAARQVTQQQGEQAAAYRSMVESEERDPTGLYSHGGMSAGGIFGEGVVALPDHDTAARSRGVQTRAQMAGVEQSAMMMQMLSIQQQMQQQALLMQRQRDMLAAAQERVRLLEQSVSKESHDDPWEHPEKARRKRRR